MKHKENRDESLASLLKNNKNAVSYIFLGIGLTLFMLNISTLLSFTLPGKYAFTPFDLSTFGSMIIIIAATYMIHYK